MKLINKWLCKNFSHEGNDVKIHNVVLSVQSFRILMFLMLGFLIENMIYVFTSSKSDVVLSRVTILYGFLLWIGYLISKIILSINIAHCDRKN